VTSCLQQWLKKSGAEANFTSSVKKYLSFHVIRQLSLLFHCYKSVRRGMFNKLLFFSFSFEIPKYFQTLEVNFAGGILYRRDSFSTFKLS
jgi:hypothetical protein